MGFWKCVLYLCITGLIGFLGGRILPKKWLKPDRGIFRCFPFEKDGRVYEKLGIRKWHKRLPDMSRILPFMMPPKNLQGDFKNRLPEMIQETCVAELVHIIVSILGLYCLRLWPGAGGIFIVLIHTVCLNVPFILIQRYNRPRLMRLQSALQHKERSCQVL